MGKSVTVTKGDNIFINSCFLYFEYLVIFLFFAKILSFSIPYKYNFSCDVVLFHLLLNSYFLRQLKHRVGIAQFLLIS